ncbi:NADH dehydrogenase ubiquinone iron-sulfur protein [Musa troglodytarum]|uniref:NADH dehydrogenase [ubiquinone] iron-sulfur protein 5 n=1 Tax=Musa troglodytarum TaxID=320322 RepID=A0A9E7JIM4_9LILI|nr:NADH dehydrogenase ubiquinone iron-sulfur protein [Musa troglodytarum]
MSRTPIIACSPVTLSAESQIEAEIWGKEKNRRSGGEGEAMASGWGITGNKGRCYDFWIDFSECMSRCREPKDCNLLREDYFECLHHTKEVIPSAPSNSTLFLSLFFFFKIVPISLSRSCDDASFAVGSDRTRMIRYGKFGRLTINVLATRNQQTVQSDKKKSQKVFLQLLSPATPLPQSVTRDGWPAKYRRRNRVYKEEQRQIRAAAQKAEEAEGGKESSRR